MELFNQGFQKKSEFFDRIVTNLFERFYPEGLSLPNHLIHVTCTGYVDPSPAKKLVVKRGAGQTTTVTHAYHMGCYAAFPALRIAVGFSEPTDIVHTELCTLHMNPSLHETEQLVAQTLFADGYIKYSVQKEGSGSNKGLKVLALHEEIIDDSSEVMKWVCHDWGLKMTLAKEIPVMIARALPRFLETLSQKGRISIEKAFFAIHPGGPKIIDQVAKILKLEPFQYRHSAEILRLYGNMSSATLPHVWDSMIRDEAVQSGTPIVSFAFGPGLCLSGGVFQCVR
jgi:predicted naringenin-chalcone synthase